MSNITNTATITTPSASDTKKAEYARLFDLFERLASCRLRQDASMDDFPTSQELDPLLKKLSAIVDTSKTSKRTRRNTVASIIGVGGHTGNRMTATDFGMMSGIEEESSTSANTPEEEDEDDEIESLTRFPLANAKKYPFTFRLMVHKLYKKDEWARTIKEMLEKSKNEFKSLAEQQQQEEADAADSDVAQPEEEQKEKEEGKENAIRFKVATSPGTGGGGGRRGSVSSGRKRSQSITGMAFHKAASPTSPSGLRSPGSAADAIKQSNLRALKKRCVGRRKSMSEPLNAEAGVGGAGEHRGTWIYDAAISSAERPTAATFTTFPPGPPPSPTAEKYQPLGGMRLPSKARGAAGIGGAGMKRRVSSGGDVPLLMPLQQVTNTNVGGLAARRWAKASSKMDKMQHESEALRKSVKRPLLDEIQ